MSVAAVTPRRWKKPPLIKSAWLRWTLAIGAAVYLALVFQTTPVNWTRVWEGLPRGAAFMSAFFPPDFVSRWDEIAEGIAESLWMTVVSTVVGIALSIPVGIGAAKNIAPAPVYYFCRARARDLAQLPGNHPGDLLRQAVRFRAVRRPRDAFLRHHRLLRQAACRGHRGHGSRRRRKPCARRARAGCNGSITACSRR